MALQTIPEYKDRLFQGLQPVPKIKGKIKAKADEFVVDEVLFYEPEGSGEHLYLQIEKTGANTEWVALQLAKFLDIRQIDVSYAGRKDRHAVTTQWFSCYLPKGSARDWRFFSAEGVVVKSITWGLRKLRPGQLACNLFRVKVHLERLTGAEANELIKRLTLVSKLGFPNYFGPQRFGRDGNNLQMADQMLRKGVRVRGNRGMLISAARSWLFNRFVARELDRGRVSESGKGPLVGRSRDPQSGEEDFTAIELAWAVGLRKLRVKASTRALLVKPKNITWTFEEDGLILKFGLPSGSYATSLLREVFLVEDLAL